MAARTIESTGLFLTITFSHNLSRSLKELMASAQEVGRGIFSNKVPVRSRDELGQLAEAINKMNDDLENSIGARRQAETASQVKSLFLANMSHEIRTPLGGDGRLGRILKDRGLNWQDHMRYVDTIERTGRTTRRHHQRHVRFVESGGRAPEIQKIAFCIWAILSMSSKR